MENGAKDEPGCYGSHSKLLRKDRKDYKEDTEEDFILRRYLGFYLLLLVMNFINAVRTETLNYFCIIMEYGTGTSIQSVFTIHTGGSLYNVCLLPELPQRASVRPSSFTKAENSRARCFFYYRNVDIDIQGSSLEISRLKIHDILL
jgi:hypothetical protein